MKFSILVPVYNVEKYLSQCIESLLCQTYKDFEIILVDDGSVDSSGVICDGYKERYPDIINVLHKPNEGLISSRRVGIKEAKGEYCIFVDSDDFIEPDLLETVNSYSEEYCADIVIYSFRYFRDGKYEKRKNITLKDGDFWDLENKTELYERLVFGNEIISICAKAIRTDILRFDPTDYSLYYNRNMGEDLLQSLYPLTAAERVVFADRELYNYRLIDSSISHNYDAKNIAKMNTLHIYEKIKEYLPLWGIDNDGCNLRLDASWLNGTMYFFCKFYESAKNKKQRKEVTDFDWNSFLPENGDFSKANSDYLMLYNCIRKKEYNKIKRFFVMKKLRTIRKNLARALKG